MSKYNIVMRQKNQSSTYDDLYPESLDTQIKISKDTTGLTSQKEDIETIFTKLNENKNNILLRYKKLCAYIDTLNTKEDIDNVDYDMDIL